MQKKTNKGNLHINIYNIRGGTNSGKPKIKKTNITRNN